MTMIGMQKGSELEAEENAAELKIKSSALN